MSLSRRDFLRTSSGAVAGSMLGAHALAARVVDLPAAIPEAASADVVRFGIIGVGMRDRRCCGAR